MYKGKEDTCVCSHKKSLHGFYGGCSFCDYPIKPIKSLWWVILAALALFLIVLPITCAFAESATVHTSSIVQPVEIDMWRIMMIESSGNPNAVNKYSRATGLYGITPTCLEDYNKFGVNFYSCSSAITPKCFGCYDADYDYVDRNCWISLSGLFDPKKNERVARWYMNKRIPTLLKHFGHKDTIKNRLISYNCGVGCVDKPLPKETRNYIKRYHKLGGSK